MADGSCEKCAFRAKHDENPKSLAGRFWRWHINFCPGWKKYFISLTSEEKSKLAAQYNFRKYQKPDRFSQDIGPGGAVGGCSTI